MHFEAKKHGMFSFKPKRVLKQKEMYACKTTFFIETFQAWTYTKHVFSTFQRRLLRIHGWSKTYVHGREVVHACFNPKINVKAYPCQKEKPRAHGAYFSNVKNVFGLFVDGKSVLFVRFFSHPYDATKALNLANRKNKSIGNRYVHNFNIQIKV